jgi:hypothetical protein
MATYDPQVMLLPNGKVYLYDFFRFRMVPPGHYTALATTSTFESLAQSIERKR